MRRVALCAAVALAFLVGAPTADAQVQGPAVPQVYVDHQTGLLVYITELPGRAPGQVTLGTVSGIYWFANPLNPLQPGFGCRFIQPSFQHFVRCDPPVNGFLVALGPGPNDVRVLPSVPELPGPNRIEGGKKGDKVQGGKNDEKIETRRGKDKINPGDGNDDVKAGAGDDAVNSRDGERDRVDCGKGKDRAVVDPKDKVRNCERVERK